METLLERAQGLVYALLHLMPSSYQHASLSSLGLFLEAARTPIASAVPDEISQRVESLSQCLRVVDSLSAAHDSPPGVTED